MKCEICPVECELTIDPLHSKAVSGNRCERGREFAEKKLSSEEIFVTGRIRVSNGNLSHLPVVTDRRVSPSVGSQILSALSEIQAEAPIRNRECIVENIAGSGADLIAARSIRRREVIERNIKE